MLTFLKKLFAKYRIVEKPKGCFKAQFYNGHRWSTLNEMGYCSLSRDYIPFHRSFKSASEVIDKHKNNEIRVKKYLEEGKLAEKNKKVTYVFD